MKNILMTLMKHPKFCLFFLIFACLLGFLINQLILEHRPYFPKYIAILKHSLGYRENATTYAKPTNNNVEKFAKKDWEFKVSSIYALVYYTQWRKTSILLRYLEANARANGGILDKIVFAVKTKKKEDLEYLDSILSEKKPYIESVEYTEKIYEKFQDDDLIFKIDDDIVFISNGTFERMVEEYTINKLVFLSANVVNHPLLSYVHARLRAIMPFYEESPYKWVKYENSTDLEDTVAQNHKYDLLSIWWSSPKCAAMAHESFFYHFENKNLQAYDFYIWDFHSTSYARWNINFVLMRGKYVNKMRKWFPDGQDEEQLISMDIPEALQKHVYALGTALVVNFAYSTQDSYLEKSSFFNRYELLSRKYT